MTPKEAAYNLATKIYCSIKNLDYNDLQADEFCFDFVSIGVAIISIDEILDELKNISDPNEVGSRYTFWIKAKEILKEI